MKTPLESRHIDHIIRDICEYLEIYDSPDAKYMASFNLELLEKDAKRALQNALSISDNLLKYINSPSDVVYDSNLGIDEDDDNYILTRAIADALYIILTITYYHEIKHIKSSDDKDAIIDSIEKLRNKILVYRGLELENEAMSRKYKLSEIGKTKKKAEGICVLIRDIVRNNSRVSARDVWKELKKIATKRQKFILESGNIESGVYTLSFEEDDDDYVGNDTSGKIVESPPENKKEKSIGFKAVSDHVTEAKKTFKKKNNPHQKLISE